MRVRLTQLDGKLPNLALAKLAAFHRAQGDEIVFTRNAQRDMFEGEYDRVYGSAIFTRSQVLVERLTRDFPDAIVGGTGTASWRTVEDYLGQEVDGIDYGPWPDYAPSLGFTMRGCRLACNFCVVPRKEGRPRDVSTIADIWRGEGHPKDIVLLDNDFFGQPRAQWEARIAEIRDGGFQVSFNQGINVRLIDADAAAAIATVRYRDDGFSRPLLYTAWDNFKDEAIFHRGVGHLLAAGIAPSHIMVYMLVGFDPTETWERIFHRLNAMVSLGLRPYPMVYEAVGDSKPRNAIPFRELKVFQKWVVRAYYEIRSHDAFRAWKHLPPLGFDAAGTVKREKADARAIINASPSLFETSTL